MSISDVCLHVAETLKSKKVKGLVPEYNCLMVSPANLWGMDPSKFDADGHIMKTVFKENGRTLSPSVRGNGSLLLFIIKIFREVRVGYSARIKPIQFIRFVLSFEVSYDL